MGQSEQYLAVKGNQAKLQFKMQWAAKMLENATKQFSKSKTYEMKNETGGKVRYVSQRKLQQELPDEAAATYMQSCHAMKGWTKFCPMANCWLFRWDDSWMQTKTSRGFTGQTCPCASIFDFHMTTSHSSISNQSLIITVTLVAEVHLLTFSKLSTMKMS